MSTTSSRRRKFSNPPRHELPLVQNGKGTIQDICISVANAPLPLNVQAVYLKTVTSLELTQTVKLHKDVASTDRQLITSVMGFHKAKQQQKKQRELIEQQRGGNELSAEDQISLQKQGRMHNLLPSSQNSFQGNPLQPTPNKIKRGSNYDQGGGMNSKGINNLRQNGQNNAHNGQNDSNQSNPFSNAHFNPYSTDPLDLTNGGLSMGDRSWDPMDSLGYNTQMGQCFTFNGQNGPNYGQNGSFLPSSQPNSGNFAMNSVTKLMNNLKQNIQLQQLYYQQNHLGYTHPSNPLHSFDGSGGTDGNREGEFSGGDDYHHNNRHNGHQHNHQNQNHQNHHPSTSYNPFGFNGFGPSSNPLLDHSTTTDGDTTDNLSSLEGFNGFNGPKSGKNHQKSSKNGKFPNSRPMGPHYDAEYWFNQSNNNSFNGDNNFNGLENQFNGLDNHFNDMDHHQFQNTISNTDSMDYDEFQYSNEPLCDQDVNSSPLMTSVFSKNFKNSHPNDPGNLLTGPKITRPERGGSVDSIMNAIWDDDAVLNFNDFSLNGLNKGFDNFDNFHDVDRILFNLGDGYENNYHFDQNNPNRPNYLKNQPHDQPFNPSLDDTQLFDHRSIDNMYFEGSFGVRDGDPNGQNYDISYDNLHHQRLAAQLSHTSGPFDNDKRRLIATQMALASYIDTGEQGMGGNKKNINQNDPKRSKLPQNDRNDPNDPNSVQNDPSNVIISTHKHSQRPKESRFKSSSDIIKLSKNQVMLYSYRLYGIFEKRTIFPIEFQSRHYSTLKSIEKSLKSIHFAPSDLFNPLLSPQLIDSHMYLNEFSWNGRAFNIPMAFMPFLATESLRNDLSNRSSPLDTLSFDKNGDPVTSHQTHHSSSHHTAYDSCGAVVRGSGATGSSNTNCFSLGLAIDPHFGTFIDTVLFVNLMSQDQMWDEQYWAGVEADERELRVRKREDGEMTDGPTTTLKKYDNSTATQKRHDNSTKYNVGTTTYKSNQRNSFQTNPHINNTYSSLSDYDNSDHDQNYVENAIPNTLRSQKIRDTDQHSPKFPKNENRAATKKADNFDFFDNDDTTDGDLNIQEFINSTNKKKRRHNDWLGQNEMLISNPHSTEEQERYQNDDLLRDNYYHHNPLNNRLTNHPPHQTTANYSEYLRLLIRIKHLATPVYTFINTISPHVSPHFFMTSLTLSSMLVNPIIIQTNTDSTYNYTKHNGLPLLPIGSDGMTKNKYTQAIRPHQQHNPKPHKLQCEAWSEWRNATDEWFDNDTLNYIDKIEMNWKKLNNFLFGTSISFHQTPSHSGISEHHVDYHDHVDSTLILNFDQLYTISPSQLSSSSNDNLSQSGLNKLNSIHSDLKKTQSTHGSGILGSYDEFINSISSLPPHTETQTTLNTTTTTTASTTTMSDSTTILVSGDDGVAVDDGDSGNYHANDDNQDAGDDLGTYNTFGNTNNTHNAILHHSNSAQNNHSNQYPDNIAVNYEGVMITLGFDGDKKKFKPRRYDKCLATFQSLEETNTNNEIGHAVTALLQSQRNFYWKNRSEMVKQTMLQSKDRSQYDNDQNQGDNSHLNNPQNPGPDVGQTDSYPVKQDLNANTDDLAEFHVPGIHTDSETQTQTQTQIKNNSNNNRPHNSNITDKIDNNSNTHRNTNNPLNNDVIPSSTHQSDSSPNSCSLNHPVIDPSAPFLLFPIKFSSLLNHISISVNGRFHPALVQYGSQNGNSQNDNHNNTNNNNNKAGNYAHLYSNPRLLLSKSHVAQLFVSLLVLNRNQIISISQDKAYGHIGIMPGPVWDYYSHFLSTTKP